MNGHNDSVGWSVRLAFLVAAGLGTASPWAWAAKDAASDGAEHQPHAGMLRYPDISGTTITFVYANDIWTVPREGGSATPLASPPGPESFPRFSPDGRAIAFVGNYDGNRDIYTVPTEGGLPARLTHHPETETLCDWTADGRLLFFTNGLAGLARQTQLFTVPPQGGLPVKLPVPYGANGAISPDGQWLAYTPHTIDHRTWKRYRGGMATDIWLFNLLDNTSKRITDWEGTDSQPMWHDNRVYYMSDAGPEHRLNIWAYDVARGSRTQVTKHTEYDVKWPAVGPGSSGRGEIVYQLGPQLSVLDLASGKSRSVPVRIPGDRPTIRPHDVDASKFIQNVGISATGKRAVIQARGDIWTVPAKHGSPLNLTRSSGIAEREPAWSPDGKSIACFSDATGEYELYTISADGKGEAKRLTSDGACVRFAPVWSPDSKHIAFTDKTGKAFLHSLDGGETKLIDTDPYAQARRLSWSHDSAWIAFARTDENRLGAIWVYHVPTTERHRVTAGRFNDSVPTFDREGKYLAFASARKFAQPTYGDVDTTFVYSGTEVLVLMPLRAEVGSPWAPKSDDEGAEDEKEDDDKKDEETNKSKSEKKDDKGEKPDEGTEAKKEDNEKKDEKDEKKEGDDKKEKKKIEPLVIELAGMEERALLVPVESGIFSDLSFNHEGKLIYMRRPPGGREGKSSIKIFDLGDEEKKEKAIVDEADGYFISADGKKLLIRKAETMAIVDAAADQKLDKPLSLTGMTVSIDPRAEWRQIFMEAWRIKRVYFYDPHMHGVDWLKVRDQYSPLLEDCASREDVSYVIGEMISELNVGHAYVRGDGDVEPQPKVSVGLLGADYELHEGAYRIAKIHQGAAWDADARSPLSRPGLNVKQGDYLLAVNGVPVDVTKNPWAAFQGLAGKTVRLTVSAKPALDDTAREVLVEPLETEVSLRYRSWVERNRAYVEGKTGGQVGYLHVPSTGIDGQNELFRQFFGQIDKQALIIDERWNSGGQIPTRFIELLNRPVTNYWAVREGRDWVWPPDSHQGPKCMLVNGLAGSGGDCFPYYFRKTKLGKLIGRRTWGGLVGISGNPSLIDGGQTWAPTFAFYETDGTWGVEGHGVDPDIEVVDDPALMIDGGDPQLDKAIEQMLAELERTPYKPPTRPAYPDRTGMGLRDEDR